MTTTEKSEEIEHGKFLFGWEEIVRGDLEAKTAVYSCVCGNRNYIKMYVDREDGNFESKFAEQVQKRTGDTCYC